MSSISDAPVADIEFHRVCRDFNQWLHAEKARSRLETILKEVSDCIDAITNAYERAADEHANDEDYRAYLKTLQGVSLNPASLYDEVDRIAEKNPDLKALAETVRNQIYGLSYLI